MQSISNAICRLREDAAWFARAHEVRLLSIRTSSDLRKEALKQLAGFEFHADNFSPWVVFEDSRTAESDGWRSRANRLAKDWESRRQAFAKEQITLPPLDPRPPNGGSDSPPDDSSVMARVTGIFGDAPPESRVAPFLLTAGKVIAALREPLRGLVLVLAPAAVDDPEAFEAELEILLQAAPLARCRWVWVLPDDTKPPRRLLESLGDRALECDAAVDPEAFERDVEALVANDGARSGTAGPRGVKPPPRVDDPPALPKEKRDAELLKAGIDPRYIDESPKLRNLLIGAALAMKQQRGADAVRQQREARDLCADLHLHQAEVICQIGLASYLSGLGLGQEAVRELEDAARCAHEHGLEVHESQAYLALGLVHALAQRLPHAAQAYVQAAKTAEAAKMPLIAIEGWRLAGQLAAQEDLPTQATGAFQEAIRIASSADPEVAKVSSAPEAARTLAALCRKRGLTAQADSLEAQAKTMEEGPTDTSRVRSREPAP